MTMLSFRADDHLASQAQRWAERMRVDRSELLREALRRHLLQLASEVDSATWERLPLEPGELALAAAADWGPAEDWSDWAMQRGEIWFAQTPSGGRPVLVLTRDPVANRIGPVVVAAITRTQRGLVSELPLTPTQDGVPSDCVVNFDNVHTLGRGTFRRLVTRLSPARMAEACRVLRDATGC